MSAKHILLSSTLFLTLTAIAPLRADVVGITSGTELQQAAEQRITRIAQSKDTPIVLDCGAGIRSPLAATCY